MVVQTEGKRRNRKGVERSFKAERKTGGKETATESERGEVTPGLIKEGVVSILTQ